MTDELGDRIRTGIAQIPEPSRRNGEELVRVQRKGSQRRLMRRSIGIACLVILIMGSAAAIVILIPQRTDTKDANLSNEGPAASEPLEADRAATFAIRALAQAELVDTTDVLYDYQGITDSEQGWIAAFGISDCTTDISEGRCTPQDAVATIVVGLDKGTWRVLDFKGPVNGVTHERVVSYGEQDTTASPRFEFPTARLVQYPDTMAISGSPLWTGPIPAPDYGAICHGAVLDAAGHVILSGGTQSLKGPMKEGLRSGSIVPIAIPNTPEGQEPEAVEIRCDSERLKGWQPVGNPSIEDLGNQALQVGMEVMWEGPPVMSVFTRCTVSLKGPEGLELGTETHVIRGPDQERDGDPPYRQVLLYEFPIPADQVSTASATCEVSGEEG